MADINVPADESDIASAITAASDDDTIIVADGEYSGEYNRNLDFANKRLTLKSANGPQKCFVDASTNAFVRKPGTGTTKVIDGFQVHSTYAYGFVVRNDDKTGLTVKNCWPRSCIGRRGMAYVTTGDLNTKNNRVVGCDGSYHTSGLLTCVQSSGGSTTSKHDTVIDNAMGAAISLKNSGATATVDNAVFWTPNSASIDNSVGATENVNYSNLSTDYTGVGTGNINSQPWTTPALHADDPGVDVGTDLSITTDMFGATRDASPDMGSLEYSAPSGSNTAPTVDTLVADPASVERKATSTVTATASDDDDDVLTYSWEASSGTISGSGSEITWTAPDTQGTYSVACIINDGNGGQDVELVPITVTGGTGVADDRKLRAWMQMISLEGVTMADNSTRFLEDSEVTLQSYGGYFDFQVDDATPKFGTGTATLEGFKPEYAAGNTKVSFVLIKNTDATDSIQISINGGAMWFSQLEPKEILPLKAMPNGINCDQIMIKGISNPATFQYFFGLKVV
tara:strand:+ start:16051 stop:17583 length:1533 start_codon:yes stop_codon:yes gene_type:complete